MRKTIIAVTAIGALILVGGAGAAGRWIITSTHQIKPNVLRELHGQQGLRGYSGQTGPPGAVGPAGAAGGFSTANVTEVTGPEQFMCANGGGSCQTVGSLAQCPAGSVVLGGGWNGMNNPPVVNGVGYNTPIGGTSWDLVMTNWGSLTATVEAYAICATGTTERVAHTMSESDVAAVAARNLAAVQQR